MTRNITHEGGKCAGPIQRWAGRSKPAAAAAVLSTWYACKGGSCKNVAARAASTQNAGRGLNY